MLEFVDLRAGQIPETVLRLRPLLRGVWLRRAIADPPHSGWRRMGVERVGYYLPEKNISEDVALDAIADFVAVCERESLASYALCPGSKNLAMACVGMNTPFLVGGYMETPEAAFSADLTLDFGRLGAYAKIDPVAQSTS